MGKITLQNFYLTKLYVKYFTMLMTTMFCFTVFNSLKAQNHQWIKTGTTIAIKATNGKYISSENGKKSITATRSNIGSWEKFTVINAGNGRIALRGNNGKYISSENGKKPAICNRSNIGSWEKFYIIKRGNYISLKGSNGKYISSENGKKPITCYRRNIGSWEKFIFKKISKASPILPGKISKTQVNCGSFQPKQLTGTKAYSNDGKPIKYQWQIKTHMNGYWKNIYRANGINYTPKYAQIGSRWYRRAAKKYRSYSYVYSNVVDIHAKRCEIVVNPGKISETQKNCGPFQPKQFIGTKATSSDGGAIIYQWQIKTQMNSYWKNITGANSINYTPEFAESGSKWYRRIAKRKGTTKYACSNAVDIHVIDPPKAEVIVTDIDCNSDTGNIQLNFEDHPKRSHIGFSINNGTNFTIVRDNIGSYSFNNLVAGDYNIIVKWGNNDCPINLGSFTIKDETIDLEISENQEICLGEYVILTANSEGEILWSTGETTQSITVTPNESKQYSATATKGNCTITKETLVTVSNPAVIVEDQEICFGSTATLTAEGEGTVLWSTGETTQSIEVSPKTDTTYSVTLTNEQGCTTTAEANVTVNFPVIYEGESDLNICLGEEVTLTAAPAEDYLWSTGETTQTITVSPTEDAWIRINSTVDGCKGTHVIEILVSNPTVTVEDQEICFGSTATLTAVGEGTVIWSTGATTQSIEVSPKTDTTYSVTLTNEQGCTVTAEANVTVNFPVIYEGESDLNICLGEEVTLTAAPAEDYLWSTGETTQTITVSPTEDAWIRINSTVDGCKGTHVIEILVSNPTVIVEDQEICFGSTATLTAVGEGTVLWSTGETTQSIEVSPKTDTTYSVTLTNEQGCTATAEANVTVNFPVIYDGENDFNICLGEEVTLTAAPAENYLWSTGETTQTITVSPTEDAWIRINSTVDGCDGTHVIEILVSKPSITVEDQEICLGSTATLTAIGEGIVLWSTGETTESIEVSPETDTTYSVTLINLQGCTATTEATVTVNTLDGATAGEDQTIEEGETAQLIASGGESYLWDNGDTNPSRSASPTETTTYEVTIISGDCSITDTVTVFVTPKPIDFCSEEERTILVGPNPTTSVKNLVINITVPGAQKINFALYDIAGNPVTSIKTITLKEGSNQFLAFPNIQNSIFEKQICLLIINGIEDCNWSETFRILITPGGPGSRPIQG